MTEPRSNRGKGSRPSALDEGARLLAARALTVHELRTRLARRRYDTEEIESALRSLCASRYLDDRSLSYNVATGLALRRMFGRARVGAELRRRGIARDVVAEALERVFADLDEDDLALRAAGKHPAPASGPEGNRARQRLARALLRRGFSSGIVARVLGRLARADGAPGAGQAGRPGRGAEDKDAGTGLLEGFECGDEEDGHDDEFATDT